MKLDRITFRRLFPTGAYANESIELSGTLEENEDVMNAYTQLYNMAKELHHSQNKEFYEQTGTHVRDVAQKVSLEDAIINDINNCTVIDEKNSIGVQVGLLAYEELASKNPIIKAQYDLMYQKLKK
jgi:predicted DNA-binding ArsR family transcriptional regulator